MEKEDDKNMDNGVDLDLYSRQIGAFGLETMGKLIKMRCFLLGLRGVYIFLLLINYIRLVLNVLKT